MRDFSVLQNPDVVPPNVRLTEWNLMVAFWNFLAEDHVSILITIPGVGYRMMERQVLIPGDIITPESIDHAEWTPFENALINLPQLIDFRSYLSLE